MITDLLIRCPLRSKHVGHHAGSGIGAPTLPRRANASRDASTSFNQANQGSTKNLKSVRRTVNGGVWIRRHRVARMCGRLSSKLLHLCPSLLQPVRHAHLAVHRRRGSEMLLRLRALARAPVELAEAEVAVGDEGAHAARLGERERLAVMDLAPVCFEAVGMGRDVAEQVQRIWGIPEFT